MKNYHLTKKDGDWRLKREGTSKASKVYKGLNKSEARKRATKKLKNSGAPSSLKIHKENGRIQEERTYPRKSDPHKSLG